LVSSVALAILFVSFMAGPSSSFFFTAFVFGLSEVVFFVLILCGVASFSNETIRDFAHPRPGRTAWRIVAFALRRAFFGMAGLALVIAGPIVVLRGGSTVGAGCIAAFTGAVCLWLVLHPRSPLVQEASDDAGKTEHD
jgi:hypothetical protein